MPFPAQLYRDYSESSLGGGETSNIFWKFHPYLGKMFHFDEHIFHMGGSTTNQRRLRKQKTSELLSWGLTSSPPKILLKMIFVFPVWWDMLVPWRVRVSFLLIFSVSPDLGHPRPLIISSCP